MWRLRRAKSARRRPSSKLSSRPSASSAAAVAPGFCRLARGGHRALSSRDCRMLRLCRRFTQIVIADRQRAKALAGGGKDRVRHRGADRPGSHFGYAAPHLAAAGYDMDVDLRGLREAHHAIGIEIALYCSAVLDRDLAVERGAQAEDHRTFGLLGDGQGIDHVARVECDSDAINLRLAAWFDGNLGDLRAGAVVVLADRDAAARTRRQRLAPIAFLRRGIQYPEPVWLAGKELASHLIGIEVTRVRDLVEEAFDGKDVLIDVGRAPEPHRQVRIP